MFLTSIYRVQIKFISYSKLLEDCICLDPENLKSIKKGLRDNPLLKVVELTNTNVYILIILHNSLFSLIP